MVSTDWVGFGRLAMFSRQPSDAVVYENQCLDNQVCHGLGL